MLDFQYEDKVKFGESGPGASRGPDCVSFLCQVLVAGREIFSFLLLLLCVLFYVAHLSCLFLFQYGS
jgi:hypothetical protein